MAVDRKKIIKAMKLFIEGIGEDPNRDGLCDTPERVARMCEEIYSGVGLNGVECIKALTGDKHDEIVLVRDIPFYSICEHHFLPFIGKAHVAYIPKERRITGLSKLARVVDVYAKRPQLQERLTTQIAEAIMEALRPRGVMVVIEAEHLCMTMRGIKTPGAVTVTSVLRGLFRNSAATRSEAMALIQAARQ